MTWRYTLTLLTFPFLIGISFQDDRPCREKPGPYKSCALRCTSSPNSTRNYLFTLPNDTCNLELSFKSLSDFNSTFLMHYPKIEILFYNSVNISNKIKLVLTTIPNLIKQNLKQLLFQNNDILIWPENLFTEFLSVTTLKIQNNKILSINANQFFGLHNLIKLDLSTNKIELIQKKTFINMSKLEELLLRGNELGCLEAKMFEGLNNIKMIDLSGNKIKNIPLGIFENAKLPNLLNLERNDLSVIDKTFLKFYDADSYDEFFKKIKIKENDWICDCHIVHFVVWLKKKFQKQQKLSITWWTNMDNFTNYNKRNVIGLQYELKCKLPFHLESKHLLELDEQQLLCDNENATSYINCTKNSTDFHKASSITNNCPYKESYENCLVCQEGFFMSSVNGEPLQCSRCPPLTSSEVGAQSIRECYCIQGFQQIMSNNALMCEACPRNTFKSTIGPEKCIECDRAKSCETTYVADIECHCQYLLPFYVNMVIISLSIACLLSTIVGIVLYIRRKNQIQFFKEVLKLLNDIDSSSHINLKISQIKTAAIKCKSIQYGPELGDGCYGKVYQAKITNLNGKKGQTLAAVKQLKKNHNDAEIRALQCELKQLIYVGKHTNIVEFYGFKGFESKLTLIYEYAANGDLLQYVKQFNIITKGGQQSSTFSTRSNPQYVHLSNMTDNVLYRPINNGKIDETNLITIMYHIANGMEHLASLKCIHRDLAARNILLTGTSNIQAKVADFGLARDVYKNDYYKQTKQGPLPIKWMSIEAIEQNKFSTKSDVWSFGVVFWEVFTLGKSPFANVKAIEFLEKLKEGLVLPNYPEMPNYVYNFIRKCMNHKTSERPDFRQLRSQLKGILQNEYITVI